MAGQDKSALIRIGDFFFKWRNQVFPLILLALFLAVPPRATLFGSQPTDTIRDWLAGVMAASGLVVRFATIGWAYIKRGGHHKKVYADTLVTSGYFGLCRNPLYLGNLLIYAGLFVLHGDPLVMILGMALFAGIYVSIVAAEEYFLAARFGAAYDAYCRDVPRWLPVMSRHGKVTRGMNFSLKRALIKDYPTIFNTVLSLIVLELLERYHTASHVDLMASLPVYGALLAVMLVFLVLVKLYKSRQTTTP